MSLTSASRTVQTGIESVLGRGALSTGGCGTTAIGGRSHPASIMTTIAMAARRTGGKVRNSPS
jgi:hypothetical protein